jgi:hypothetical protein
VNVAHAQTVDVVHGVGVDECSLEVEFSCVPLASNLGVACFKTSTRSPASFEVVLYNNIAKGTIERDGDQIYELSIRLRQTDE